jgi:RNA polymerase sigma-70 factor (ECF subfamily)
VLGKRAGAVRTAAHRGLRRLAERLTGDPNAGLPHHARPARTTPFGSAGVTRPRPPTPQEGR